MDGPPGQDGRDRLGIRVGEEEALLGQRVEVRCVDPVVAVGTDVIPSQTVHYHHDYVHLRTPFGQIAASRGCGRRAKQGKASGPRARDLQEVLSSQPLSQLILRSKPTT